MLLRAWRSSIPAEPARHASGGKWDAWAALQGQVAAAIETVEDGHVDEDLREQLISWTLDEAGNVDPDRVDAVAWGISDAGVESFEAQWLAELTAPEPRPFTLREGDLFPVPDPSWRPLADHRLTARPSRMRSPDVGDLPHVRAFKPGPVDVVIDPRFDGILNMLIDELQVVAALWPNQDFDEFALTARSEATFTIAATDPEQQATNVDRVIDAGLASGATVLALPELSTARDVPPMLRDRLERFDDKVRLIVAGSCHEPAGEAWTNTCLGVISDGPDYLRHDKLVPVELRDAGVPRKEAVEAFAHPITIYAAAGVRLAILICRDYLDQGVGRVLDALGVNLILVPAMSDRTDGFATNAHGHVAATQAVSFVVNGPLSWHGDAVVPAAVLAQPIVQSTVVELMPPAATPAVEARTLLVRSLTSR